MWGHGLHGIAFTGIGASFSSWTTRLWTCSGTLAQDTSPSICKDEGDASVSIACKAQVHSGEDQSSFWCSSQSQQDTCTINPLHLLYVREGSARQGCQRSFSCLVAGHDSSPVGVICVVQNMFPLWECGNCLSSQSTKCILKHKSNTEKHVSSTRKWCPNSNPLCLHAYDCQATVSMSFSITCNLIVRK